MEYLNSFNSQRPLHLNMMYLKPLVVTLALACEFCFILFPPMESDYQDL